MPVLSPPSPLPNHQPFKGVFPAPPRLWPVVPDVRLIPPPLQALLNLAGPIPEGLSLQPKHIRYMYPWKGQLVTILQLRENDPSSFIPVFNKDLNLAFSEIMINFFENHPWTWEY